MRISNPCHKADPESTLFLIDSRPLTNAKANHFRGAGFESEINYKSCKLMFMDIQNVHAAQDAFNRIGQTVVFQENEDSWADDVESSGWLQLISKVLQGGVKIAHLLERHASSVVTHCSDGWDRTPQICCLAELILDPFYRTLEGFIILIEKEWIHFGHMFMKRCNHLNRPNEEVGPIFIQFLDAVWQFSRQFPEAFEFNECLLLFLALHVNSCRFGSFLFNSEKEAVEAEAKSRTTSIWSFVLHFRSDFLNCSYQEKNFSLFPNYRLKWLRIWEGFFLRFDRFTFGSALMKLHDAMHNLQKKHHLLFDKQTQLAHSLYT